MNLNWLKPDLDKWVMTVVLLVFYWATYLISTITAEQLHSLMYPLMTGTIPPEVSFNAAYTRIFENYQQQVEQSKLLFVLVKLGITVVTSYLTSCVIVYMVEHGDGKTDTK